MVQNCSHIAVPADYGSSSVLPDEVVSASQEKTGRGWKFLIGIWYVWLALARLEIWNMELIRWSITSFLSILTILILSAMPPKKRYYNSTALALTIFAGITCFWAAEQLYAVGRWIAFAQMILWGCVGVPCLIKNRMLSLKDIYQFGLLNVCLVSVLMVYYGGFPFSGILSSERFTCGWRLVSTGVAGASMLALPFLAFAISEEKRMKMKWVYLFFLLLNIAFLLSSKGRAGIITAVLLVPFLLVICGFRLTRTMGILAILAIFLWWAVPEDIFIRILRLNKQDLTSYRGLMFQLLWDAGNQHNPIWGNGMGMDRVFLQNYIMQTGDGRLYTNPHNQFISVFYNWGWCGVVLFYSFILLVLKRSFWILQSEDFPERKYLLVFACWFLALAIQSNGSGGLDTAGNGYSYLFWLYGSVILLKTEKFFREGKKQA